MTTRRRRTRCARCSRWWPGVGLSEERIRIVSPDIGGGFGGKVPVYPAT